MTDDEDEGTKVDTLGFAETQDDNIEGFGDVAEEENADPADDESEAVSD